MDNIESSSELDPAQAQALINESSLSLTVTSGARLNGNLGSAVGAKRTAVHRLSSSLSERLGVAKSPPVIRYDLSILTPSCCSRRLIIHLQKTDDSTGRFDIVPGPFPKSFDLLESVELRQLCSKCYVDCRIDRIFP